MTRDSDFVRDARKTLGLTQTALANKLGVTRMTVSRYERDDYELPTTVRLAIERLLDEGKSGSNKG